MTNRLFLLLLLSLIAEAQINTTRTGQQEPTSVTLEDEESSNDDNWGLILGLFIAIAALSLMIICLVVVICEIRTSKQPPVKEPEIQMVDAWAQEDPPEPEEEPVEESVTIVSTTSEEEPAEFGRELDGLYNLGRKSVIGRYSTVTDAKPVDSTREVIVKVYDNLDFCQHEHAFYTELSSRDLSQPERNQAKAFTPILIDAGMLTLSNKRHPALVIEKAQFSLKDYITPKKGGHKYVVLSERSTFFQICNSLRFIHHKGYAHGDLHPGSVMFFSSRWKLTDFSSHGSPDRDMICRITPHYTAPEVIAAVANGHPSMKTSQPSDIWSIGMIGWEILTKTQLLNTSEFSNEEVEAMSMGDLGFPWEGKPVQFWSDIKSPAAVKIIQNCLHRDPDKRWTVDKIIQYMRFWS